MNQHDGLGSAIAFQIDEVSKREFHLVHAVDEGQLDAPSTQFGPYVVLFEEVIAGLCKHALLFAGRLLHSRIRIDTQGQCVGAHDFK